MCTAFQIFTSVYDSVGNRTSIQELDGSRVTYTYDDSYQLTNEKRTGTSARNTTYAYDAAGNRTTYTVDGAVTTTTYDSANQMTLAVPSVGNPITYTFDNKGNNTVAQTGASRTTYTWDDENRLTVQDPGTGSISTFTYRPDGKRIRSEFSGADVRFMWDGENVLQEHIPTDIRYYLTDYPGYWGGLVSTRNVATGSNTFLGFDPSGNMALGLGSGKARRARMG